MGSIGLGSSAISGASGLNVQTIVEQLLYAERTPARYWERERTQLDSKAGAARDINSKLLDLKTKINALRDLAGKFNAKNAVSANASVVTVSADATAISASHSILVSSLATTSSYYSSQLADASTTFAAGSFDLQVGSGPATTITVDATNNTLDGLAAHINGLAAGVRASIITDANGARLSLVSETSGAPGDVTITNNTTGLSFTKAATGANAGLTVNGVPISSTSNTIDGAVAGVTLNLVSVSVTAVSVSISQDTAKAKEAVSEFVESYNAVVQAVNVQFTAGAGTGAGSVPPLFADSSLRMVQETINASITYSISGNNGVNSLGALGVNMQDNGTLSIDGVTLDSLLAGSFEDVQNLFQGPSGLAENFHSSLSTLTDSVTGALSVALKGISDTQAALTSQIEAFDVRLDIRRVALYEQYNRVDGMLRQLPGLLAQVQSQIASLR